jgi:hypothetical protein
MSDHAYRRSDGQQNQHFVGGGVHSARRPAVNTRGRLPPELGKE